jgi:hypothetical protein
VGRLSRCLLAVGLLAVLPACSSSNGPDDGAAEFVVDVVGETFVIRVTDPRTILLARARLTGGNSRFPAGPLRPGSGTFNAPWTWHLDPDATRMVEVAIEVCDGRPSYVERNQADFPTYCPWGARIVAER